MTRFQFRAFSYLIALGFTAAFCTVVVPALLRDGDVLGAFAAGFVNPYASGYSTDVIFCWLALALWITYERNTLGTKHGWLCLVLGIVPGVAVGFALYLVLRSHQTLGSAGMQTPAYLLAHVDIQNPDAYREYMRQTPRMVQRFGGRFIVRGGAKTTLEGPEESQRIVLIEFPTMKDAQAFYRSAEYQNAKRLREGAGDAKFVAMEGYPIEEWQRAVNESRGLGAPEQGA